MGPQKALVLTLDETASQLIYIKKILDVCAAYAA